MSVAQSQQPSSIELNSQQLLELWGRLAHAHTMVGGGCSCGVGGATVALADFEQDIVDYIQAEAERSKRVDVLDLLEATGRDGGQWCISELLGHFTHDTETPGSDAAPALFILERLTRTLRSFEKLHRGK